MLLCSATTAVQLTRVTMINVRSGTDYYEGNEVMDDHVSTLPTGGDINTSNNSNCSNCTRIILRCQGTVIC
jgi:hypothetical protein